MYKETYCVYIDVSSLLKLDLDWNLFEICQTILKTQLVSQQNMEFMYNSEDQGFISDGH